MDDDHVDVARDGGEPSADRRRAGRAAGDDDVRAAGLVEVVGRQDGHDEVSDRARAGDGPGHGRGAGEVLELLPCAEALPGPRRDDDRRDPHG